MACEVALADAGDRVFHHVFEHEMYHVGEISLLLRQQGLTPLPF